MPRRATFGFEAEFEVNANAVISRLHALGYAGAPTLHSYHCDCDACAFGEGFAFRGQTDSSCSGEVISDILGPDEPHDSGELMAVLADVAVNVDAEPGLRSGFHCHVGIDGLTSVNLRDALWQVIRWEPTLTKLAGGRWNAQRTGMNTTVRDCVKQAWDYRIGTTFGTRTLTEWEHAASDDELGRMKDYMLGQHMAADRHSNLNIQARSHPTWEFRLWNSTRSAWRMELFTGLSVALMDPVVIANLAALDPPLRRSNPSTGFNDLALACDDAGHVGLSDLIVRQGAYLDQRADNAPAALTVL